MIEASVCAARRTATDTRSRRSGPSTLRRAAGKTRGVEPRRLRVRLDLLATERGGRSRGVFSGYSCQWRSDRKPDWNDAKVEFADHRLEPGTTTDAELTLAEPKYWHGRIEVGDALEGGEGSQVVATAIVLEILHA